MKNTLKSLTKRNIDVTEMQDYSNHLASAFRVPFLALVGLLLIFTAGCKKASENESDLISAESKNSTYTPDKVLEAPTYPRQQQYEKGRINPVDEATKDQALVNVRDELLSAISYRDVEFLQKHLASDIKCGFDANNGVEMFKTQWQLNDPVTVTESPLWELLGRVLMKGGTFYSDTLFVAPYTFTMWPDEYDPFTHGVITGSGVRVRDRPSLEGGQVSALSYEIVGISNRTDQRDTIDGNADNWYYVRLQNGRTGYVFGHYLESGIGFRAGFGKRDGKWKMVFFVSGD